MKIRTLKIGLLYGLALISGFLALFITFGLGMDFFDPVHMELSLQMVNLSEGQIFLEDALVITVNVGLVILLIGYLVKGNYRKALLTCIGIIISIAIFILIDSYFRFPLV